MYLRADEVQLESISSVENSSEKHIQIKVSGSQNWHPRMRKKTERGNAKLKGTRAKDFPKQSKEIKAQI